MSVYLIRPMTPQTSRSGLVSVQYPVNLGYLAAYLKAQDISCIVRDFEVETYDPGEFLSSLKQTRPRIVGFSCMTPHIKNGAMLARLVKSHFPEMCTVLGGVHGSAIPEQTLQEFPEFDIVVLGEGEQTLVDLYNNALQNRFAHVPGIAYIDHQQGICLNERRPFIENLDEIPFPDRQLVNIDNYRKSHVSRGHSRQTKRIAEIMCSRGCPYDCIFCASKVVHSRRVRFRSPQNIIAEMEHLLTRYHIEHFSFLDDTFTLRKDILSPVCQYMGQKKVSFDAYTRVNEIDEEKLQLMIAGGCKKISFGIESGSPRILKKIKKSITVEQIEKAFMMARKTGLHTTEATFMIGCHPDETLEDMVMTKDLIYRLKPDIMVVNISIPYPGTELNRILKQRGILKVENWDEFVLFFSNPSWELGNVPMHQIRRMLKQMTYGYFLRPSYLLRTLAKNPKVNELKYWFTLGLSFIRSQLVH
jgi:anaerobic magnesium-protoporphyrin IX monomethyl ester cyclase